jgi:hypothetical protein
MAIFHYRSAQHDIPTGTWGRSMKLMSVVLLSAVAVALAAGAANAEQHGNADRPDHGSRAHAALSHVTAATAAPAKTSEDISVGHLIDAIRKGQAAIKGKLANLPPAKDDDEVSINDMFEMQMLSNHLAAISDMSPNVVSASNAAIGGMARNFRN